MNEYQGNEYQRQEPEEIQRDIERTRERMSSNIDELGDRLSPDNLKNQAREAISGKAQDVVSNVGDQARQTGSRVVDFITQNPLPVAAVSLGAIWLFSLRNRSEVSGDRMARFAYTGPERREPDGRPSLGRRLADRAEHMKEKVSDATSHAGERASERAGELKERAREARGGFERMMQDNPLAVAVGAAVIGVALGLLLPETEREREMLGPARDRLGDRVQSTAERVKDATVEAGRDIKDTVKEEVSYRAPEVKSTLKDAAATVGQQVKESAGRVAQEAKQEAGRKRPEGGMG
jgi:ElaB/YqjD/DUF883 family membrane-anchored ribosome-binding protein